MTKDTKKLHFNHGETKKFLYTGPNSKEPVEEDQWNFSSGRTSPPPGPTIDLENVWSIKRNVAVNAAQQDRLTLNANKIFYSRYGGTKGGNASGTSNQKSNLVNDVEKGWPTPNKGPNRPSGVMNPNISTSQPGLGQRSTTDINDF